MSSLFGSNPTPATGQSLFGASQQAPAAGTGSSLFGATQQTPAAGTGSLFGGATQQTPAAGASSLFGSTLQQPQAAQQPATTTPAANSLFGTTATATTTSAAPTSLFGSAAPAPAAPTTSLFAASAAQPQAQQAQTHTGSLWGAGKITHTNNPTLFDSLLAKSKKQADGESGNETLPSLQLGLGDLQQRLRTLGSKGRPGGVPLDGRAHYLLAASGVDPGAAVKDLGAFAARAGGRTPESRPLAPAATNEVDVESYLSNLQTKTTLSMISDGLERSVRDFDSYLEENVHMEWDLRRKRIYEHFGIKVKDDSEVVRKGGLAGSKDDAGGFGRSKRSRTAGGGQDTPGRSTQKQSVFGKSSMLRSVIGSPSRIGAHTSQFRDVDMVKPNGGLGERFLDDKQRRFIEKIHSLNEDRIMKLSYPIFDQFAEVTTKSGDVHAPKIVEAYQAMMEVVGEDPSADPAVPSESARERQFAYAYIKADQRSPEASDLRKRIIAGANRYLEKQAFREVEATIAKSPQEANLGGRPDVVSKIRAYIRVLAAKKNLVPDNAELQQVQGEYIWAIIFYLLRTGHVNEAATFVNDYQSHFNSIDRPFPTYINGYASSEDRRLKRPIQERCNNDYMQRIRNSPQGTVDPYRAACYKIIGRCDLATRSLEHLRSSVEDWVWLQFNLARESDKSTELATESYGLSELQENIKNIGEKHFAASPNASGEDDSGSFGMFFFLQILAGMYESAVAYLYPFARTDAVHFGIALEYYGLIRPADAMSVGNELKSFNSRGVPQLNFAPMVGLYTQDFRAADVAAAVDYIILICLNMDDRNQSNDRAQAALCHEALRALVLETREFSKLIGDIRPDGQRIKGMIEERGPLIGLDDEEAFLRTISLEAARAAEDSGRTTDAVLLNHLAGDYDAVIVLVSRSLSESISLEADGENHGEPLRLAPVKPRVVGAEAEAQMGSSLSLAAIDDPVELAKTMLTMYERDQMFRSKIRDLNRTACGVLLKMSEIKGLMTAQHWPEALDRIRSIDILPLGAKGDPSAIRSYAVTFSGLPQAVASNVPHLVMWTTECCTRHRERLASGQFTGNAATARMLYDELRQITLDLTTYTSQLRYRFPPAILEALAKAIAD